MPSATWGREDPSGREDRYANGSMFGVNLGEAGGTAGLDTWGTDTGGGGTSHQMGLGPDGVGSSLGHGHGPGDGPRDGTGFGKGRTPPAHTAGGPSFHLVPGIVNVGGHLPAEVVQRIVRQNFGRFRACYEAGLRGDPSLQGRVSVKFVIDRSGAVATAQDAGSDIPDRAVIQCVVSGFLNLSFPEPEGGQVTVVYPIALSPAD
jgi:hypothetical protein